MRFNDIAKVPIYVLCNKAGHLQGLDKDSGGYPYTANTINEIQFWVNKFVALEYLNTAGSDKYFLVEMDWSKIINKSVKQ